jgi:hypothetical protein
MAEKKTNINGGFFNSINDDRKYTADDMNRPYKRLVSEGVFATPAETPSTDLQVVSAVDGMNIIIKKGEGILGGKWFENATDIIQPVSANNGIVPRRDSIIIQVDNRQTGRVPSIVYREGVPSSTPVPPDINTIADVVEKRVANIYVAPGATDINDDAIVDLRGSSELLWITSLIKQVDTSELFRQWQSAYSQYFTTSTADMTDFMNSTTEELTNYISEKTETFNEFMETLTSELTVYATIIAYESAYTSTADDETTLPINIPAYDKAKDLLWVHINHFRAIPGIDYTIDDNGENIVLTKGIQKNTLVSFLVQQSIIIPEVEPVLNAVADISNAVSNLSGKVDPLLIDSEWINLTLESGAVLFNTSTTPAVRQFGNQTFIRGAIKGLDELNVPVCTLPTAYCPSAPHYCTTAAFSGGAVVANCTIEIKTDGTVVIIAKSGTIPTDAMLPISTNFIVG